MEGETITEVGARPMPPPTSVASDSVAWNLGECVVDSEVQ